MSHSDQLRQTLTHLHQELETVSTADPEVRGMLSQTLREIADRLEAHHRGELATRPVATLADVETVDQLRASARQFEVDHPQVATAIESVVDALSRMGI
ncbi:DUF4404 family protein [Nannocystis bainbridge]|uniref:DUF4404 family protein n=1 Tax=Nannocystis bainbridge TaxID=2995303 RepID=A0ABT5EC68_9BACT|nr:DUF4404 family protein [Nannocystis bainbridge]MDC0723447.1 DUF4404 family protein [Nannocystis bainbridge]